MLFLKKVLDKAEKDLYGILPSGDSGLNPGGRERIKGHKHTLNEEENIWLQNGGKYKSLAEAQLQIRLSVPKKE